MKKFTKVIALIVCFAMIACFAACQGGTDEKTTVPAGSDGTTAAPAATDFDFSKEGEYTANNTEYVIGATGPLTGDASAYGISVQNGAQLAVDEINAAGGLNGVNFKLNMLDDKAAAADASTAYDQLFEGGMQVSLGSVTSGACESFAGRAGEDGVFFMTPSASAASVIETSKYAFRVCFGDPDQGSLSAEELTKSFKSIGAIYDNSDPYSTGVYEAFKTKMAELGVSYKEQSFDAENNRDFATQVEALKDCDAIFLPIYYTEAGLIAQTCAARGCTAVLFGCDGLDGIDEQINDSVTNTIKYITPFDVNAAEGKSANFTAAYKAKYNSAPDQFAADGYDAVYVIYNAMLRAGVNNVKVDPATLGDALIATITAADFSFEGVTGNMTWDATGACTKVPVIVELG